MKKILFSVLLYGSALYALQEPPTALQEKNVTSDVVKKLVRHVTFLKRINTTFKKPVIKVEAMPAQCKHELMRWCIKKIHDEQCMDVIFDVWDAFTTHCTDACADDALFVHDFAALLYVVYMNITTLAVRTNFQDFMTLYTQVSGLPIEDLLTLLDIFYERLGIIFQAYSTTASYGSLIKEYWWVPVAILTAGCTQLVRWYLKRA
jgi:hypothetical protein